jgi:hypothetical protein
MTTFEEMNQLMLANGWELIEKKSEYEHIKKKNKQVTARIGWAYFKLKQDKDLEIKMWKEKYENAVDTMGKIIMMDLETVRQSLNKLVGEKK